MKNILHVNYSRSGGAGRVAETLSKEQNSFENYKSQLIFKIESDLWNKPYQDIQSAVTSSIDNFIVKKNNFLPLFSLYRDKNENNIFERIKNHRGIIHLHWINGILEVNNLLKNKYINSSIVWSMHDMNPFTGGCHHALGCLGYENNCENCPAVRNLFKKEVSENRLKKKIYFQKSKDLKIVVPSQWLADKAVASGSISEESVRVIPNPIDPIFFQSVNKDVFRKKLKIPQKSFVVGFVSQQLDNPLKNLNTLIDLINKARICVDREIVVLAIGDSSKKFHNLGFKLVVTGPITDVNRLVENYCAMDLIVSTSVAETFGLSIAESAALGVPSLIMDGTAASELVKNGNNGFVAKTYRDFIERLIALAEREDQRSQLGENAKFMALKKFQLKKILKQYDEVYDEILYEN